MKQFLFAASALALAVGLSAPAFAQTSAEDCTAMFSKVDVDTGGWIGGDEAKPYVDALGKAGLTLANEDGKISKVDFMAACEKDAFKGMAE